MLAHYSTASLRASLNFSYSSKNSSIFALSSSSETFYYFDAINLLVK